jgi:hypothetical protein
LGATISQAETLVTGFVCKYLGVGGNIRKIFTLLIHGRSSRLIFPNHRAFELSRSKTITQPTKFSPT